MHELSIIQKIISAADEVAEKNNINKVSCVRLKLGVMAAVKPEELQFCFETYAKGTRLSSAKLLIEEIKVKLACKSCGNTFGDKCFDDSSFAHTIAHMPLAYIPPPCPKCASIESKVISGNEMQLTSLEGG